MKNKNWAGFSCLVTAILFMLLNTSCIKERNYELDVLETDSVMDIDGNVYKTVKIGNQWWMAENLKVRRYNNGDSIIFIGNIGFTFDSVKWVDTKKGAFTNSTNVSNYGLRYNGYCVSGPQNIAPEGWHVPGDEEWKEMEIFLGMAEDEAEKVNWRGNIEGNKLKIQIDHTGGGTWIESDFISQYEVWGTNESGFTARAGGCVLFNGVLSVPGEGCTGFWWTASKVNDQAWYRYLDYTKSNVFRYYGSLNYGFSIRCVKD